MTTGFSSCSVDNGLACGVPDSGFVLEMGSVNFIISELYFISLSSQFVGGGANPDSWTL